MRFNALIVAASLLATGGLVAYSPVRESLGLALDYSWQLTLVHVQFALAPLLFLPVCGSRKSAASNLASAAACWASAFAVLSLFSFATMGGGEAWGYGSISACVWLAASGVLSLAARFNARWVTRGRVLLLCAFGLPALWHYLMLEYGEASGERLRPLSPSWQLAVHDIHFHPLLVAGLLAWAAALAMPGRRQA